MYSLKLRTDYNTAAKILNNIYKADPSAGYSNKKRTVTGSVLSAFINYDKDGCYVLVKSTYYTLPSLKEISGYNKLAADTMKAKQVHRLLIEDDEFQKMNEI